MVENDNEINFVLKKTTLKMVGKSSSLVQISVDVRWLASFGN